MSIESELRYIQILRIRGTCIDLRLNEIEGTLRDGDKYKKIVEEMNKYLEPGMICEIPEGMVIGSRHIDIIKYIFKELQEKYFPKPKEEEAVLILDIKGEKELVNWWVDRIKKLFEKEEHIDVNEGTRGEEE